MITDAEFWIEVRRKQGGDSIFRGMLALLHARQCRLDARTGTTDRVEFELTTAGKERRDLADGKCLSVEEKKAAEAARKRRERELQELEEPVEANKAFLPRRTSAVGPGAASRPCPRVATITMRVLQQIMLFATPIYPLRYNIPAMSMSWNTSCFIDRLTKQLITFGAGQGVKVPQLLYGRGCVAGDGFFAILSDGDEVWASGGLKVSSSSVSGPTPLGREETMTGIAAKTLMLVGHGQRLASVTRAFSVRSLSALSNPTRSIIPSRPIRFLDLGYGDDYYMVGTDSIVYKTTASKRAISTPRRVMTLARMAVSRISSGTSFLLIIDQNGHLYCLGRNRKGQLGNGEKQDAHRKPYFQDSLTHHFFTQVAAGDCHSLALTSSGLVYGAGSNESGQLGLGPDSKEVLRFTEIPLPEKCIGIAAGPAGSMFALADGQVLACGLNDSMQLGVESATKIVYEPAPIAVLVSGVESYTMDFGGFGRSEPEDETGSVPWEMGETAAHAKGTGGGGDGHADLPRSDTVGSGMVSGGRVTTSATHRHNVTSTEPIAGPQGGDGGSVSREGDGAGTDRGTIHTIALTDATVIHADNDNMDDSAGTHDVQSNAGNGSSGLHRVGTDDGGGKSRRHRRGAKRVGASAEGDGKTKPAEKKTEGGCKCCTVM